MLVYDVTDKDSFLALPSGGTLEKKDKQTITFEIGGRSISQPLHVQRILDSSYTCISRTFLSERGHYERGLSESRGSYKLKSDIILIYRNKRLNTFF